MMPEEDLPIVVRHARLDSPQAELGPISTIACAADRAPISLAATPAVE
jgi:hypothetical protein